MIELIIIVLLFLLCLITLASLGARRTPAVSHAPAAWLGILQARARFNGGEFYTVRILDTTRGEPVHGREALILVALPGPHVFDDAELLQPVGGEPIGQDWVLLRDDDAAENIILLAAPRLEDAFHCFNSRAFPAALAQIRKQAAAQHGGPVRSRAAKQITVLLGALTEEEQEKLTAAGLCRRIEDPDAQACGCHAYIAQNVGPRMFEDVLHASKATTPPAQA